MSQPTQYIRDLAQNLVSIETKGVKTPEGRFNAALGVCDRIRPHLVNLLGGAGFHALLSRSLAVSKTAASHNDEIRVRQPGALELSVPEAVISQKHAEGALAIITHLLGLLVAFIGEGLTIQIVHNIWPEALSHRAASNKGGKK